MKLVEPIREIEKIQQIMENLYDSSPRDYCLFVVGINIGLRISDLRKLRWDQVYNKDGSFRQYIDIVEQKTEKPKRFPLEEVVQEAISYWKSKCPQDRPYLFNTRVNPTGYISRRYAHDLMRNLGLSVGLENIGTHSLRKTFGYFAHKIGTPISVLMKLFNHSDEVMTMKYIGIDREQMDKAYCDVSSILRRKVK